MSIRCLTCRHENVEVRHEPCRTCCSDADTPDRGGQGKKFTKWEPKKPGGR